MNESKVELESFADALEATGDYRVLRRLPELVLSDRPLKAGERVAVVVDTETTGLNLRRDEAIELAMICFAYNEDGEVTGVLKSFSALNEPSLSIGSEVAAITGITPEMVKGHVLDVSAIERFLEPAALIIAHNAAFDRPICERISPLFSAKPWACTLTQLDWQKLGFEGRKLTYLLYQFGYFHENHRALGDASATLDILRLPLPSGAGTTLPMLLAHARLPSVRIWVESSPEFAPVLRERGYRWQTGTINRVRSWWIELDEPHAAIEIEVLRDNSRYVRSVEHRRLSAFERFKLEL